MLQPLLSEAESEGDRHRTKRSNVQAGQLQQKVSALMGRPLGEQEMRLIFPSSSAQMPGPAFSGIESDRVSKACIFDVPFDLQLLTWSGIICSVSPAIVLLKVDHLHAAVSTFNSLDGSAHAVSGSNHARDAVVVPKVRCFPRHLKGTMQLRRPAQQRYIGQSHPAS